MKQCRSSYFNSLVILASFLYSISAFASSSIKIEKAWKEKKVSLKLEQVTSNTEIQFKDESGVTLNRKSVLKGNSSNTLFNLEGLEPGQYSIVISSEEKDIVQPLIIKGQRIEIDTLQRIAYFAPEVVKAGDKIIDVSLRNHKLADVEIILLDKYNDVVFSDVIQGKRTIKRRYNLEESYSKAYTVKVITPYKIYLKNIK